MGFSLNKIVSAGTLGLVPDITGEDAAAAAAAAANAGSQAGIAENRRQFDLTRADLLPFLTAATGEGGALNQLVSGIDQAPGAFSFDPNQALNNPALQFQQQMGQQQVDRIAGLNRNLGSGQRFIEAQKFGQGLASQSLNEDFNRQLIQHQSGVDRFNSRLNRLAGLVDVGRGTGSAIGSFGANASSNISNLMNSIGNNNAAAALQKSAGINNLIGQGIGAAGMAYGGGAFSGGGSPSAGSSMPAGGFSGGMNLSGNMNLGLF